MSGICGIVDLRKKIDCETDNISKMTDVISHRGKGKKYIKNDEFAVFGCVDYLPNNNSNNQFPFSAKINDAEYTICFDGLIYNPDEIKKKLCERGINCYDMTDAEIVLHSYAKWGAGCLQLLNGIFAFTIYNKNSKELFFARDRFGIKPLYYALVGGKMIFASEIKGVLSHPLVSSTVSREGLCEVLGLGPACVQGSGIFKDICEIMPAHCGTYNKNGLNAGRYWTLHSNGYEKDFDCCLNDVKMLTQNAIDAQLDDKGRRMCYFLSGGVDSSIITAMAARRMSGKKIDTFSLRYKGNDEFFAPTEYQPASDDYFINIMTEEFGTNHHIVTVDNESLVGLLYDSMKSRDMPGMADVDSSLYFLCREMSRDFDGAVSGECADEIFGGYPWFHRKEDFECNTFPWAKNTELRKILPSREFITPDEISQFIQSKYKKSILECPVCHEDSPEEKRRREISYLNINWFMYTLGARSERIGMNCCLEIRMPFCDHRIVEYMWNVPWHFKAHREREKGLLRACFEDILPEEILWRKKSPFPKTHNPEYEEMVKEIAKTILQDKNSITGDILNKEYILNLMNQPSDYGKPWFGQLMSTPQLYAYIIQFDLWIKEYKIKFEM